MAAQKEENGMLQKTLMQVNRETAEQKERVAVCSERILIMEEQVGILALNAAYKQSIAEHEQQLEESATKATDGVLLEQ